MSETLARLTLEGVEARIREREDARDWASGLYEPKMGELTPAPMGDMATRTAAWQRHLRQIQSQGPRVMNVKLGAALGGISWGKPDDNEKALDERLEQLKLRPLALELLKAYLIDGIMAAIAHTVTGEEEPRISRLGGYLEPYFDPADIDRVTGLFQTWSYRGKNRTIWTSRTYDWSAGNGTSCVVREWQNLDKPTNLGREPSSVTEDAPLPRYRIYERSHDGLVLSPILQAIPLFKALWATETRLTSVEEFALPILTGTGQWEKNPATGQYPGFHPGALWVGAAGSEMQFIQLSNQLSELREQRKVRLETIREFLGLPGGFLGNDSPSGEALREANIRMSQNARQDADDGEELLTEVVADYCALAGLEPAPVSIQINRAYDAPETVDSMIRMLDAGIIPFAVAAREIQAIVGGSYSDDELRAFIETQTARITPQSLQQTFSLGDSGGSENPL